jgi:GDP-L-fucose synthase
VPAALIRRLHEAKVAGAPTVTVWGTVWGTGKPRREFLAVDDLADACVFALKHYTGTKFLNVGGKDITIAEFAQLVADVVGYQGRFVFDTSRPDGTPQKLLDVSELSRLGWRAQMCGPESRFLTADYKIEPNFRWGASGLLHTQ